MEKYTLVRKQRKTLSMRLDKDGNVTVSAPLHISQSEIDKFVLSHTDWIIRKRKELSARNPLPRLTMTAGEWIPFLGREYVLRFHDKRSVTIENGVIFLPKTNPQTALTRYYAKRLKEFILPLITHYSRFMGVQPQALRINSARTRWGSCSAKNGLNFSFRLAMCDAIAVEYVVVHELCHIRYKNHSKVFWNEVEKYFPQFQKAKQYLKQISYFMEII
ncbi:MAG: M48 family metallopeptidase [Clostridia bacterium]|nr:M48 family metallopeptidase [Clostridia bacterium]